MWKTVLAIILGVIATCLLLLVFADLAIGFTVTGGGESGAIFGVVVLVLSAFAAFFIGGAIASSNNRKRYGIPSIACGAMSSLSMILFGTEDSVFDPVTLQAVLLGAVVTLIGGWAYRDKRTSHTVSDPLGFNTSTAETDEHHE